MCLVLWTLSGPDSGGAAGGRGCGGRGGVRRLGCPLCFVLQQGLDLGEGHTWTLAFVALGRDNRS